MLGEDGEPGEIGDHGADGLPGEVGPAGYREQNC
jgi:hypothetical protein